MSSQLRGTGVALVTPFDKENAVDYQALKKLVNHCIKGGVNSLIVLGTTGETPTLTKDEKAEILRFVAEIAADKVNLIAGFGGNNTQQVIDEMNNSDLTGYRFILSASPYYNKPTQEGIYQHYKAIAKASPLPIVLYNVPGRTSSNMLPETTLKLAREVDKIVAVKEASGNIDQCMKLVKNKPKDFIVLSGDDNLVVPQLSFGMDGCISVIANLLPKEFSTMINHGLNGEFKEATAIQFKLSEIIDSIFEEGNPVGIKSALSLQNITSDAVRLPLVNASESLREKIKKQLIQI
ncbi:MAG: 4-hydroxy-tetrahydrodipicolinate synthase [Chitinophagales bacterium]|nr:4-hydroxy-tetrahydrodipicolinate synthase [Chitinophagales bacterium]